MKMQLDDSGSTRARLPSSFQKVLIAGLASVLLVSLTACPPQSTTPDPAPSSSGKVGKNAAPIEPAGWRHKRSRLVAGLGAAGHSAVDAMVNPRTSVGVHGKFAYGKISKDLQDEEVWLQLASDDGSWVSIGRGLTDSDGRVTLLLPYHYLTRYGPTRFRFLVSGDLSVAEGYIWVLKRATKAVVFDIDGTLTTGDSELIDDAFGGDIDVRKGAVDVVRHWADTGHMPVYLTGRPYMYNKSTRAWLQKHGFPLGPMATANSLGQAVPSEGGVGKFKTNWLRSLQNNAGVVVRAAYGNASTDICGFARAGISPSATYIIANDQKACEGFAEVNLIAGDDYIVHAANLKQ